MSNGPFCEAQDWTLDGLGNFGTFNDDGASQDRTVNEANEIESISGGWITPVYDAAGNMISGPKRLFRGHNT
jgi:hypothetical protein